MQSPYHKRVAIGSIIAFALLSFTVAMPAQAAEKHDHGNEAKHEHGKKEKHGHGGESITNDLGTTTVAGITLSITQETVIEAGGEGAFDIIIAERQKAPKTIRAWYGVASAEGSVKTKAESEPNRHYHSHVEVPKKIPAGSRYWVEVEPETGKKGKTSFEVKAK